MPSDPDLALRGRLIRGLGAFREMLPGSFVERRRSCGKANCRCADGQHLHTQYQLSVLAEGKLKTFNVPPQAAEEVRRRVDLHRRFQEAVAHIAQLNLRRWLSAKEAKGKAQEKP